MEDPLPKQEVFSMYKRISKRLVEPYLLNRLERLFKKKQTLEELLDWVHTRVKFNKGAIIRHNDPFEIIKYGQGKCREFSILFTAVCLANNYRARIILDLSDHVWIEVWDSKQHTWMHVDPSEKRINDPEMYERDWKKDLKEVYAFEDGRQQDVTQKYKIKLAK